MENLDNNADATATAPTVAFDITRYAAKDTATIKLTEGDGETPLLGSDNKTQLSITVYGPGSKEHGKAKARATDRFLVQMKKKGKQSQTAEELRRDSIDLLVATTISFDGPGFTHPDAQGETGETLFRAVYSDPALGFIKDQVSEFVNDWENFTNGSATS